MLLQQYFSFQLLLTFGCVVAFNQSYEIKWVSIDRKNIISPLSAKGHISARTPANDNVLGRFWSFGRWQLGHHHCHGLCQDPQSVSIRYKILVLRFSFFFRTFPINFVLLALFTAAESVLVGQVGVTIRRNSQNKLCQTC